jgi:hypothetical protein
MRRLLIAAPVVWVAFTQAQMLPDNYHHFQGEDAYRIRYTYQSLTSVRSGVYNVRQRDSVIRSETSRWQSKPKTSWLGRKIKKEHLVNIDSGKYFLGIDPVFDFSVGTDLADDSLGKGLFQNTRGVSLRGYLGQKLSFYSAVYENQSVFPAYLSEQIQKDLVVPGQGRVKPFKANGFDYSNVQGMVWFRPFQWWTLSAGHDRNFVGDGYRSMLLSDFAFPAMQFNSDMLLFNSKLRYWISYQALNTLERLPATQSPEAQFSRRAGNFFALSYSPKKWIEITLFEGNVHSRWEGKTIAPHETYYLPVIFAHTLASAISDLTSTAVPGVNLRASLLPALAVYGQWVPGNQAIEKAAWQMGFRWHDVLKIKGWMLQTEYNRSRTDRYENKISEIKYAHYNGGLAHPYAYRLDELILRSRYTFRDFYIQTAIVSSQFQEKVLVPAGQTTGNVQVLAYMELKLLTQFHGELGYIINPKTNMTIALQCVLRRETDGRGATPTDWLMLSWRTQLRNLYYDF